MKNTFSKTRKLNKGFTLIELMITLVLSLMITYAIAQVLISSNRTSVTSDGMSQSQETGRFIMSFLAGQIRQAGLDSINDKTKQTQAFISCTDFSNLIDDNACITEGAGGEDQDDITIANRDHGDRLAIAWIHTPPDPADPDPTTHEVDCTGANKYTPTTGGASVDYAPDEIIINTFWVEFDATSQMNSLFCQGFSFDGNDVRGSSPQQAIANGVEAMHLLYGEASAVLPDTDDRNISRYIPAAVDSTAPTANDVTNWSQVYAVKVSIMTRSLTDTTNNNQLRRYVLADAAPYDMTDTVSRQVFTTSFVINNYAD